MNAARAIVCVAVLLASSSRPMALNPALEIDQYAHSRWKIGESFLSSAVRAIAQTSDGYLWLGTESGLLRFDGVRAVHWQPGGGQQLPSTDIGSLVVARDGRLWIGTSAGLASWKDGRLVAYPQLAGAFIGALIEGSEGTVWAGTVEVPRARLCAISSTVECVEDAAIFGNGVFSLFEERGTLLVGAATGLWRWQAGRAIRYATAVPHVSDISRGAEGALLVVTQTGISLLAGDSIAAYPIADVDPELRMRQLLVDRHKNMWIGTTTSGLVHVHQERSDRFARVDGLSGDWVHTMFEDREGNVWVATNDGLDRFSEPAVAVLSKKQGLTADTAYSVLADRKGNMWLGTPDGLTRWRDGRAVAYGTRDGLPDPRIANLFEDSAGRILVSTLGGIAAFDGGRFVPLSVSTRVVYNIVEPRPGELWINDQERGLIHLIGDQVVDTTSWAALGRDDHANALIADPARNGLWLGFYKGGVAFVQNRVVRSAFAVGEGLGAGRVSDLRLDQDGAVWAATAGGLSRITGDRIATMTTAHGLPCASVHWTLPDAEGSLWLLTSCGLIRIGAAELASWISDPDRSVTPTVFDSADGVRTPALPIGFNPSAARSHDGRLWFAALNGAGIVDPAHLPVNELPPSVLIEQVLADREQYDAESLATGATRLGPLVRDLQINYTALSFVAPEKVRFRYRLEGHDADWQDVGTRRQAFYSGLPPGQYKFRVIAANNSGVWNDTGAALQFSIAPAYYETAWFRALALGMVLTFIWSAYRIRVRVVEKHQQEISALNERLMKAQEQERMRIAGELHDGVMQQMLAMTMMLGTAKRRIPEDSAARPTLEKISAKLIEVGSDIRRLSHDLHPPILQEAGLPQAVRAYCEEFSASCGVPIEYDADDTLGDLSRGSALCLYRIVQEALGNAAKHARATRITVRFARVNDHVRLAVTDDGVGFERSRLSTSGGLGLITMRERANQLNGKFEFDTVPGRGTVIRVDIPFR
jgi:signal transduction histidine kinase/ligand-binding sensor domain-containing protein